MQEVLINRLGGLSLPRKSVVRLTERPDMTLDVYHGRKTTIQPTNQPLRVDRILKSSLMQRSKQELMHLNMTLFQKRGRGVFIRAGHLLGLK